MLLIMEDEELGLRFCWKVCSLGKWTRDPRRQNSTVLQRGNSNQLDPMPGGAD